MYRVNEIFTSIQGEGEFVGTKATFIRLAGCNLACPFCDTEHESYTSMPAQVIIEQIDAQLVVITGGEPTIQDLVPLLKELEFEDVQVAIETNGTNATDYLVERFPKLWITCSPKSVAAPNRECTPDELKYVIEPHTQDWFIPQVIRRQYQGRIWLQPEGSQMQEAWKRCYEMVQEDPRLRVGVQLHKVMGVQ